MCNTHSELQSLRVFTFIVCTIDSLIQENQSLQQKQSGTNQMVLFKILYWKLSKCINLPEIMINIYIKKFNNNNKDNNNIKSGLRRVCHSFMLISIALVFYDSGVIAHCRYPTNTVQVRGFMKTVWPQAYE